MAPGPCWGSSSSVSTRRGRGDALRMLLPVAARGGLSRSVGRLRAFYHRIRHLAESVLYRYRRGRAAYWERRADDVYRRYGGDRTDFGVIRAIIARIRPRRILDVGCGGGRLFSLYLECGVPSVVGQDVSRRALRHARRATPDSRVALVHGALLAADLPNGFCDLCISIRVLQHVPDQEIAATVARLCEWSRWVYICELPVHDPRADFYFTGRDYVSLFLREGFEVVDRDRSGELPWILFAGREALRQERGAAAEPPESPALDDAEVGDG
jgi:SAM-dependent methyltransferase